MKKMFSACGRRAAGFVARARDFWLRALLLVGLLPGTRSVFRPGFGSRGHRVINSTVLASLLVVLGAVGLFLSLFEVSLVATTAATGTATEGGPWGNAVKALCLSFQGIIGQGLSLVAIVIGGLMFAFGEGGSKSQIAGLIFGAGLVMQAPQFLTWVGFTAACTG